MIRSFTATDVPDQTGRTFFVTGANTGIGFEAAKVLAGRGARVLLGCRNPEKAEDARARILAEHGSADVELIALDLADLASVEAAAARVAEEPRLDVLVNNAGVMIPPLSHTEQGFELQMGVNHLGPFVLTARLLPKLEGVEGARIVNTSSNGHRMVSSITFDDPRAEQGYNAMSRYGESKLANLLHAFELDRRLRARGSTITVAVAHPGGTDTELFRHVPGPLQSVARVLGYPFLNRPYQGAWPTLAAATAPGVEGGSYFGPKYFELRGPAKQVGSNRASRDEALQKRFWDWSIEQTGVDPELAPVGA